MFNPHGTSLDALRRAPSSVFASSQRRSHPGNGGEGRPTVTAPSSTTITTTTCSDNYNNNNNNKRRISAFFPSLQRGSTSHNTSIGCVSHCATTNDYIATPSPSTIHSDFTASANPLQKNARPRILSAKDAVRSRTDEQPTHARLLHRQLHRAYDILSSTSHIHSVALQYQHVSAALGVSNPS
ncbi:hypothetical protein BC830DRAFT_1171492 [Chytriomyces sp. MP71]|nr:hypothetical protein BC830DRAFT_1171492 [Chytriomyces sp. MP71]